MSRDVHVDLFALHTLQTYTVIVGSSFHGYLLFNRQACVMQYSRSVGPSHSN